MGTDYHIRCIQKTNDFTIKRTCIAQNEISQTKSTHSENDLSHLEN